MKNAIILLSLCLSLNSCDRSLSSHDLLDRSIKFHDPENKWPEFDGHFNVMMNTPDQSDRLSEIKINLPEDYFYLKATRDTITTEFELSQGDCSIRLNGSNSITESEKEQFRLTCDRAGMYKNYYSYLYGLPMKLKDPGTIIHPVIENKTFKEKSYLVLKASYKKEVGTDVWYFYFNPENYAMEVYQFFKTDENGNMIEDSGEYILLSELAEVNKIKIPRIRAWYYNKDDKYLGTDTLIQ